MRFIALIILLFLTLFISPLDRVEATCYDYDGTRQCTRCVNTDKSRCCDTPDECNAITISGCNPNTGSPCTSDQRCVRTGFSQYECQLPRPRGASCTQTNLLINECADGLSCNLIYGICVAPGDDPKTLAGLNKFTDICSFVKDDNYYDCTDCHTQGKVWTALGCLPTNPSELIAYLLRVGIGLAGGIAFLLILIGGFQIMTSTGNPEHLNAGKELVGSAVTGLILIIFSVFLLRIIGFDILGLPGFSG